MAFSTTPSGLRSDYTILNDAIGEYPNVPVNSNWNTFWDVKTIITADGWFEMRIPLSSMRFKEKDGKDCNGHVSFRDVLLIKMKWIFFRPSLLTGSVQQYKAI